jgi:hypothetical protein
MEDDELSMMIGTHFSSSQTPMIATTHEDISSISDLVEEPCVRIALQGRMDLQIQEERHDLELVEKTHIYQYEEREQPLLEIPLLDQVMEIDNLIGYSLPGPVHSDEGALYMGRDDHISCLDTSVWGPGAYDISRVSAQEDTTSQTGYNVIQMGVAVGDGVQSCWHRGKTQGSALTVHQQALTTGPFDNTCKVDEVSLEVAIGGCRTQVSTTRGNAKWIQGNTLT